MSENEARLGGSGGRSAERRGSILTPDLLWFGLFFLLIFVRFCAYGLTYYPQLDDYIQYHNYAAYHEDIWGFIRTLGLLGARPLAGLADIFVWTRFFPNMIGAAAILSALYAGAGCLFRAVFRRYFHAGPFFLVVFSLLPLGFEGTYWVSASSRILCGLFFAALSLWLFQRYCDRGGVGSLLGYMVLQLTAYCFYEQILVLSCALTLLTALFSARKGERRFLWGLWSVVNAALYFLLTGLAGAGALYSHRTALMLPFSPGYWDVFLPDLLGQLYQTFLRGGWHTLTDGALRGAKLLARDGLWVYGALILLLAAVLFVFCRKLPEEKNARFPLWGGLLFGLVITAAPLAPFFILGNPWFSFRGTVTSFLGLALMADSLLAMLAGNRRASGAVLSVCTACLALVCCVASVAELHDYRANTAADQRVAQAVIEGTREDLAPFSDGERKKLRLGILNVEPSYLAEQTFPWHEHISGATESDWAMTGLVTCLSGDGSFPSVSPLPGQGPMYRAWNCEQNRLDQFDLLYLYEPETGRVRQVTAKKTGEQAYDLFYGDGALAARTYEEDKIGYLVLP